jgi:hypothetical protein
VLTIVDRCENWAECYRLRGCRQSRVGSIEGGYRSPQSEHWHHGAAPPVARPDLDWRDAEVVNGAWQAIPDGYHQIIIGAWHVRAWSPGKCERIARLRGRGDNARLPPPSDAAWQRTLQVAHGLLLEQLEIPAVVRRARLSERVREALGLEVWQRAQPAEPRAAA